MVAIVEANAEVRRLLPLQNKAATRWIDRLPRTYTHTPENAEANTGPFLTRPSVNQLADKAPS